MLTAGLPVPVDCGSGPGWPESRAWRAHWASPAGSPPGLASWCSPAACAPPPGCAGSCSSGPHAPSCRGAAGNNQTGGSASDRTCAFDGSGRCWTDLQVLHRRQLVVAQVQELHLGDEFLQREDHQLHADTHIHFTHTATFPRILQRLQNFNVSINLHIKHPDLSGCSLHWSAENNKLYRWEEKSVLKSCLGQSGFGSSSTRSSSTL